jgi:hypothetical protein
MGCPITGFALSRLGSDLAASYVVQNDGQDGGVNNNNA